eukprot:675480-Hanusia_phi.AAC.4
MIRDCRAKLILCDEAKARKTRDVLDVLSAEAQEGLSLPTILSCKELFPVDLNSPSQISAFLSELSSLPQDLSHPQRSQPSSHHLCWIYYTSGSTGRPKGVLCEHGNAMAYITNHPFYSDLSNSASKRMSGCRKKILCASAFTFDPSSGDIFAALCHGDVLCLASRSKLMADFGATILSFGATHVCSTPILWRTIQEPVEKFVLLQVVALGGEAMSRELVDRWAEHVCLLNVYGTTEATVYQTMRKMGVGDNPRMIGKPLTGVHVKVIGENGEIAREGETGEMHVGGDQVSRGYLGLAELTASKFYVEDTRFYKTGDLFRVHDGDMEFVGRLDSQVKLLGMRVELGEIEESIKASEMVVDTAVLLDESKSSLSCVCQLKDELKEFQVDDLCENVLRSHCGRILPKALCPKVYKFVEGMPALPTGKRDMVALRKLVNEASALLHPEIHGCSLTEMESKVVQVWKTILGLKDSEISPDDDFFLLGGDSLAALAATKRLLQWEQTGSLVSSKQLVDSLHPKLCYQGRKQTIPLACRRGRSGTAIRQVSSAALYIARLQPALAGIPICLFSLELLACFVFFD